MRRNALAAAVVAGLVGPGCMTLGPAAAQALTATGFSYTAGRASQDFAYPAATLQPAIAAAMEDLRIDAVTVTSDGGVLVYHGTTSDNRRASVTIRPNQGTSRVSIRIGLFGDEPLSRALMDRIGVRLGTLPPSAVPVDPPSAPDGNPYFSRDAIPDSVMLRDQADAAYRDTTIP